MASSMRKVRKRYREGALRLISAGEGSTQKLMELSEAVFSTEAGLRQALNALYSNECSNAVSQLRNDGLIESTGKLWKPVDTLESEDVDVISIRRQKRMRGEAKAALRLAHQYGRVEEAIAQAKVLRMLESQIAAGEAVQPEKSSV